MGPKGQKVLFARELLQAEEIAKHYGTGVIKALTAIYMSGFELLANEDGGLDMETLRHFKDHSVMVLGAAQRRPGAEDLVQYLLCTGTVRTKPIDILGMKIAPKKASTFDLCIGMLAEEEKCESTFKTEIMVSFYPMDTLGLLAALGLDEATARGYMRDTGYDVTKRLREAVAEMRQDQVEVVGQSAAEAANQVIMETAEKVKHLSKHKGEFRHGVFKPIDPRSSEF